MFKILKTLLSCRHSKPRTVYEGSKQVTGLAFKTQGKDVFLFVVTENSTVAINIMAKDQMVGKKIIISLYFQHNRKI